MQPAATTSKGAATRDSIIERAVQIVRKEGFDLQLLAERIGLAPRPAGEYRPPPTATLGPAPVFSGEGEKPPFWPPPPGWKPASEQPSASTEPEPDEPPSGDEPPPYQPPPS